MAGNGSGRKRKLEEGRDRRDTPVVDPFVTADLQFSRKMDDDQKDAARKARNGVGAVFPAGFNKLKIRVKEGTRSFAYTQPSKSDAKTTMVISFNPSKHASRKNHRMIGRLAQTLTHEMYVHARNNLRLSGQNVSMQSEAEDHNRMHAPEYRRAFLEASRRTFDELDNATQKRAYAKALFKDLKNEIGSSPDRDERVAWARERRDSMLDAVKKRSDHKW